MNQKRWSDNSGGLLHCLSPTTIIPGGTQISDSFDVLIVDLTISFSSVEAGMPKNQHTYEHSHKQLVLKLVAIAVLLPFTGLGGPISQVLRQYRFFAMPDAQVVLIGIAFGIAVSFYRYLTKRIFYRSTQAYAYSHWACLIVLPLFGALVEEPLYRGFLQAHIGLVPAALIFAFIHKPGRSWGAVCLDVFPGGLVLGYELLLTNNIWAPMITHFLFNFIHVSANYFIKLRLDHATMLEGNGDYARAVDTLESTLPLSKLLSQCEKSVLVKLAYNHFCLQHYEEAVSYCQQHNKIDPNLAASFGSWHGYVMVLQAKAQGILERYEEALNSYDRAAELYQADTTNSDDDSVCQEIAELLYDKALVESCLGRFAESLDSLETAIEKFEHLSNSGLDVTRGCAYAWYEKALVQMKLQRNDYALASIDRAIKLFDGINADDDESLQFKRLMADTLRHWTP